MFLLPSSIGALVHIATFAVLASAADLSFTSPNFNQVGPAGLPYFSLGQKVTISWTTPYENTNLVLYQKSGGGTFPLTLAFGNGPDNRTITWTAAAVDDRPVRNSEFHFYLRNGANADCDGCFFNSQVFTLQPRAVQGSSAQPSSTTTAATSTSSTKSSQSAAAAGSTSTTSKTSKSSNNNGIAIGVGVGVGVPVLIAVIAVFLLLARRRQKKQDHEEPTKSLGYSDATPPQTPEMQQNEDRTNRESGALGPWARNPTPTWEQHEAWEQERRKQLQVVNPSSPVRSQEAENVSPTSDRDLGRMSPLPRDGSVSSQGVEFFPYRPFAAEDAVSRDSSRHSWIDQFEFERPGYRDADELSELRRSIHGAPRPDLSMLDQPGQSSASIGDVADIPQVPQPVHESYPDDNWPLR